uniref:Reverse transcriptase domain-containing protein n=1 Tax=Lactuca sativa TaxID=4236 RepID=A0A9R1W9K3_LACSA|nr:hypothetical protein LSAT_V11C300154990 [Lactuca sativa]
MRETGAWQEVRRRRRKEDNEDINRVAISYFFQNFPYQLEERDLWRIFQEYGLVVDVYIAKKKNIQNKRFGFVRFIRVNDPTGFERKLNDIWIGQHKLHINLARFQRRKPPPRHQPHDYPERPYPINAVRQEKHNHHQSEPFHHISKNHRGINHSNQHPPPYKTYAEAVQGIPPNPPSPPTTNHPEAPQNKVPMVKMSSTPETREFLKRALVGETENFQALMNVKAFNDVEGCPNIVMRYLGGLKMLVEFESEAEKNKMLTEGEHIWRPWFKNLYHWKPEENFIERIASIMISGVPQHAWCEEAFSAIAKNWGTVVIPDECQTDCPNMAFGRVGILTSHPGLINKNITIVVDNLPYRITIMEDIFESSRLSPVLARNDFEFYPSTLWNVNDDDLGSVGEDIDDIGDYEIDEDGEIDGIPIPAASPELNAYQAEGESIPLSPQTVVEESLPNTIHPRKPQRLQIPRSPTHNQASDDSPSPRGSNNILESAQPNANHISRPLSPNPPQDKNHPRQAQSYNSVAQHNISEQLNGAQSQIPTDTNGSQTNPQSQHHHILHPTAQINKYIDLNLSPVRSKTTESHDKSKSPNHHTMESNRRETSLNTNEEIEQTIATGERIGFQINEFQEEIRNIIKKRSILSINSRGVGCKVKREWIKTLKSKNHISLLGIQETKTSEFKGKLDKAIWGSSSFLCETIDSIGLSGGIATLWDPSTFQCSVTIKGDNFLAVKGSWIASKSSYGFINVYAPNDPSRRKMLWSNLERVICAEDNTRWVVFGDFNAVRSAEERIGSSFCSSTAYHFNKFIASAGLIDLPIGGRKFTYMSSDCSKHSKLDRFLISHNCSNDWPQLIVTVLPRLHSDHCPLILSSSDSDFGAPPFRFFNSWLLDDELEGVVKQGWVCNTAIGAFTSLVPLQVVAGKLKNTKEKIKEWRNYKNVKEHKRVEELTKEIDSIDINAELYPVDDSKIELRKNLHRELMDLEAKRILDLKQKSRCKWALEGDENSAFFHGLINKNYRSQKLFGININGFWTSNPETIKKEAFEFFSKKFTEQISNIPQFHSQKFKKLSPIQTQSLEDPITVEEIKSAVWLCGNDRAPGPDGFTFAFIKKHWDTMEGDIYLAIKDFESTGVIDRGCNSSFIILVPKTSDPISLDEYRPISLIGCLYKIIAKVLAERLKRYIPQVVSHTQTTFIKDRNILDGPLIINEVISWLRKSKSKAFLFKVDFEKAFDCLNWKYLDSVMAQMNFGQKWRKWIFGCLSSARASVIINGSASKEFPLRRGVRQGDPLSPFLFILAAEGVQLPNNGPNISHLQYADDAIFLGSWSIQNAKNLVRILRCFELSSGLKVNITKSKLFEIGVREVELEYLSRSVNCSIGNLPFIYLGMPVGASMSRVVHWNPLISKFQAKLSKWKAKNLSFGGRLTLCKSVLGSLGSFLFSLYKAPVKVLKTLEKLRCRFFWGGSSKKKRITWIAWDKILTMKKYGGLDIGSLKAHNLALLGKWWWRFYSKKHELWKDVIKSIYGNDGGFNAPSRAKRKGYCWGNIVNLHNLLRFIDETTLPKAPASSWEWNNLVPGKVNILAWRICHSRLPTRVNLNKRGIVLVTTCPLCNIAEESESHLLTECSISQEVWSCIQKWWYMFPSSFDSLNEMLHCRNLALSRGNLHQIQEAIMLIYMWVIWKWL